ncbi:MAG: HlyD family type I secretion periplasmic adaptor subunit [Azonexus sp.]|nr:HlyD family type I secretion periplasmic adaptor subunit [Azonexus sp.]MCK6411712.1 HlyD family type I secretion periplasmic adaptor subunit [Azonexus sp.]
MFGKIRNMMASLRSGDEPTQIDENPVGQLPAVETDERKVVRFGYLTLAIGFGGFILWAALAPLDEGIPGVGVISVDTKRKVIQHLRGGIVEAIKVRDGQKVKSGEVLLTLVDTEVRTQLDIVSGEYWQMQAMQARLLAERDSLANPQFPQELVAASAQDPRAKDAMHAQQQLFLARRSSLSSEQGALDETITGLQQQIKGVESVQQGKKTQIELIEKELASLRGLVEEGFVPRNKLYELERVLAELRGSYGDTLATVARAQAAISETRLRKSQRLQDYRKEVESQLADVQRNVGGTGDKRKALQEELERSVIKSPTDGAVVGLEVHTIGGVVRPGERIMDIVPEGDLLVVDARLPVNLIDQVQVGQLADMHINIVMPGGAHPVIEGKLTKVSADRITDPRTGEPYYAAIIEITPNGEQELRKYKVTPQPGMPTDVVIKTGERTLLNYLLKPMLSRMTFGFREQ